MAVLSVKPEPTFDFYRGFDRWGWREPVVLDFERLPFCDCGAVFLSWVRRRFNADLLSSASQQQLSKALETITKEYDFRRQTIRPEDHPLNFCIYDVYEELVETISQKQDELRRHPPPSSGATLIIGRTEQ